MVRATGDRGIERAGAGGARLGAGVLLCLLCALSGVPADATEAGAARDARERFESIVHELFPEADGVGALEGDPRAAAVTDHGCVVGYATRSDLVAPIPAYSGKPIGALIGIGADGRIRGVRIVEHQEPILVVGVSDRVLAEHVAQYRGLDARKPIQVGGTAAPGAARIDAISGATITVMVINASVRRTARAIAASRGLPLRGSATTASRAAAIGAAATADEPVWKPVWRARRGRVWLLGAGLVLLTTILFLQDWLTRHPTLVTWLRTGFLVYTLGFIGWYALAQLSVVNVFTFVHAVTSGFRWDTFLVEPLIFVLWSYVAVTLLLWGRGVYCGWLCPYGALQELVNKVALWLRVPQLPIPALVHERLLAIKYVVLLGLFGLSLQSMTDAVRYAEIEPFKTAITLRFDRAWPYVTWALALVAVSAVNGKLFCKYLCPLGAALTVPSHFRIFDWLRRRRECGRPCQTCAVECPSQAIRPTGEINANECHHCLDCQVTYWNPRKCPPLVERRKRFERRGQSLRVAP